MDRLHLLKTLIALLFIIQCSGCAAFLEDYNYTPVGASTRGDY